VQCYAEHGIAAASPSICLSVMLKYRWNIGWNTSGNNIMAD